MHVNEKIALILKLDDDLSDYLITKRLNTVWHLNEKEELITYILNIIRGNK